MPRSNRKSLTPPPAGPLDGEGDDLLNEPEVEHASAKELIAQIQASRMGKPLFDAKVTVLSEYVDHHIVEERSELFPECRASLMDLKALGAQLTA